MGYDIIGDVHGQDGKLRALLAGLGYRIKRGAYRHPERRTALFLGDLIDRGPGQVEAVDIVRRMVDAGSARSIMGNHEWNAIGFATRSLDGKGYLRSHSPSNCAQHEEFLRQVGPESNLHRELIAWFKTLPAFLDFDQIRLCHAWWNQDFIDLVGRHTNAEGFLDCGFLLSSFDKGSDAYAAMEGVTKGMEVDLPEGASFVDHSGIERTKMRARWWDDSATTYRKVALVPECHREAIPDVVLPDAVQLGNESEVPTFLGHYWLTGTPAIQNAKTAVLDYSAAIDGPLVAYRWDGEEVLTSCNFVVGG